MGLPRVAVPEYSMTLPSNEKEVKYRPFLVKEEKLLLMAMESEKEDEIMDAIKNVINVISFDDSDSTCIDGIKKTINLYPDSKIKFDNGGDRNNSTTPELEFCQKNGVENLWGIGGNNKMNSSSWILNKWKEKNN